MVCRKMDIDLQQAEAILEKNSIVFQADQSLLTIADNNRMSPSDIFKLISTEKPHGDDGDITSGLGRKTLQQLSDMNKIDLNRSIELLKSKGLDDVTPESRVKNIADELGVTPVDVYRMLADQKG